MVQLKSASLYVMGRCVSSGFKADLQFTVHRKALCITEWMVSHALTAQDKRFLSVSCLWKAGDRYKSFVLHKDELLCKVDFGILNSHMVYSKQKANIVSTWRNWAQFAT